MTPSHPRVVAVTERAIAAARASRPPCSSVERRIPLSRYLGEEELAWEREALFRRLPLVVAHASELGGPGACLPLDVAGVPVLLTRDASGTARAFLNACRHRSTRLASGPCEIRKALVCPYHAWTYGLDGTLIHVPHAEAFPESARANLVQLPLAERHGLLWVTPSPGDSPPGLLEGTAEVGEELEALGLPGHVLFRRATSTRRANWKLIAEAFLEAYHVARLHRDTLYPFFVDSVAITERAGDHIRSATARRAAREAPAGTPLFDLVTLSYFLFPNTTVIFHPDFASVITYCPLAPDRLQWHHSMLVPRAPDTEKAQLHYERAYQLIEEQVFAREDLFIAEEMQAGMAARAGPDLVFGGLETAVHWFHDTIEAHRARTRGHSVPAMLSDRVVPPDPPR
ncbi:MAG TPA: aromatic ring-hydroxylating dioxygenase subunit alpha [Myxococcales bacterium]|nr:aromatic ring-hydroxylating dioxygenase subunit alpha [Myxococcales bacterium]